MRVQGMTHPGAFSTEPVPGTNRTLIRLFQNVEEFHDDIFDGYQYDEYHVEVETWDGVAQNVRDNYEVFLEQGMKNDSGYSSSVVKNRLVSQIDEI